MRCSTPGTSGLLSPFGKINGLYFDDSKEKDNFMYEFQKDMKEISDEMNISYIKIECDSENDYYNLLIQLKNLLKEDITMYGTSLEGRCQIVIENETDENEGHSLLKKSTKKKKEPEEELELIDDLAETNDFSSDEEGE